MPRRSARTGASKDHDVVGVPHAASERTEECLSKLILFGEKSLRHALTEYVAHHHHERNHQGKDSVLLDQVDDGGLLLTLDPTGNGDDEECPRVG